MWKNVKNLTNCNKQVPPRAITHSGVFVNSLRKISNIANEFYISKITKMREKFYVIRILTRFKF